jgi:hypothetical protein
MPELDPQVSDFYKTSIKGLIDKAPATLGFTLEQKTWIVEVAFIAAQLVAFMPPKVI